LGRHQATIKEFRDLEVAVHTPTSELDLQNHCRWIITNRPDSAGRHRLPICGIHVSDSNGSTRQSPLQRADFCGWIWGGAQTRFPKPVRALSVRE
jgi:hypothetical protein